MLVDTHAHLYWESYKDDLDEVIRRSLDAGVTTVINIGVDVGLSKLALEQVKEKLATYANLKTYSTVAIHPQEAAEYPNAVSIHEGIDKLEQIYRTAPDKVVAVGECGLDYFFSNNPGFNPPSLPIEQIKDLQRELFKAHIELARKLGLPLVVHVRDDRSKNPNNIEAWDEVFELIGSHQTVLHCYSGLPQTTQKAMQAANVLVSFAANITYPKNEYLRDAAKLLPLEKIILETDSPFLSPQSKRGQRNEPATVKEIALLVAEIKGVSFEEVADQTSQNAENIFRLRKV